MTTTPPKNARGARTRATWALRPGVGLARRDAGLLQLGVDPPLAAVVPDSDAVRLLLVELAHGGPLTTLGPLTAPILDALVAAGLVVAHDTDSERRARRTRCMLRVDAPDDVLSELAELVEAAGLRLSPASSRATAALLWTEGEPSRDRVDGWVRSGTPHLVVREGAGGVVVGPYVVPGHTACLRCVDAHLGEHDPRRALVVEQLATTPPLRPAVPDPVQRALAVAWAVHDLAAAVDGDPPSTWSATVALAALPPVVTTYRRHLHCGCAWGDGLVERVG
ncbi:MAG TPA: TOMM precursor leader peptide-binding protein [Nocardioides sp.]|uniref:TOMM precursor leader peptide-binding protein n=1 Tax=Nocardioides sp. TaxID=35761 RepID=UPI002E37C742|nr:TOMM precursor leader peptide-binding protein [Nocardioides sp.]HEX5087178.1 TOMM precursor leader peptide-binding protein [Nocardioides sp.]